MTEPYIGQIELYGFNFAPRGWALCAGQIIPIQQNTALFSILGTNYGGNGTSNFGLPNLQGRGAIGVGQGPGLSDYDSGQTGGTTAVSLTVNELPAHSHAFNTTSVQGSTTTAAGNQLGLSQYTVGGKGGGGTTYNAQIYSPNATAATTGLAPQSISFNGGGQPHNNMQPYLALNYCIAMQGVFPPRN
ncbi:phage tail protein [Bradyrhizobium prioriisuperbiae]|uniref:phage tail protein n=1 Tax=Bradyrhizobium prioriisuperbiae TaxID=2854389 RepID=UPI0028E392F9|nr:tail fiber protein [Bradyrhizobium prioritasuperba]